MIDVIAGPSADHQHRGAMGEDGTPVTPGAFRGGASWSAFTAAPHRVMMFGGAVQLVAAMALWTAELLARVLPGLPPPLAGGPLPPPWAHAWLMLYGTFPFYLMGFLMTTYPRWMGGAPVPRPRYVAAFLLLAGGVLLVYGGLLAGFRSLVLAGAALHLAGFGAGLGALWAVYRAAPAEDRFHETVLNGVLLLAAGGMLAWLAAAADAGPAWHRLAVTIGLWWFLVPLLVVVGHRMIPYFSGCVLADYRRFQPRWSLLAMVAASFLRGAMELAGAWTLLWLPDAVLAGLALLHTWRWGFVRSFAVRLLAVLHVAWLWLGIGMALQLVSDLAALGLGAALGRGPLHALGIGFAAGMTMAMATRVTMGHSGRPLVMDRTNWLLFWILMVAVVIRVGSEVPAAVAALGRWGPALAGLLWMGALGLWAMRLLPIYLRPRVDGRPG